MKFQAGWSDPAFKCSGVQGFRVIWVVSGSFTEKTQQKILSNEICVFWRVQGASELLQSIDWCSKSIHCVQSPLLVFFSRMSEFDRFGFRVCPQNFSYWLDFGSLFDFFVVGSVASLFSSHLEQTNTRHTTWAFRMSWTTSKIIRRFFQIPRIPRLLRQGCHFWGRQITVPVVQNRQTNNPWRDSIDIRGFEARMGRFPLCGIVEIQSS